MRSLTASVLDRAEVARRHVDPITERVAVMKIMDLAPSTGDYATEPARRCIGLLEQSTT
jgi:hypothetical protein